MPPTFGSVVYPESQQWIGIGREAIGASGTLVAPAVTVPSEKVEPDEKVTWIEDKSLRGYMAETYGIVQGVEIADFGINGPVYLDTLGHILFNLFGDYVATGSTPTNSTTLTAQVNPGATTATVTSGTGYAIGQAVQLGITADGNPEIVVLSNVVTNTLTFANTPARFTHASGKTVATVVAPFTHVFSLLNSTTGAAQPPTHTLTHRQGISGSFGQNQYGYWCASEAAFTLNSQAAFTHDTKGTSLIRQTVTGSALVNTPSTSAMQAAWEGKVGIGGPASGGTQVFNVGEPKFTVTRALKPFWGVNGQQAPYAIVRNNLAITGGFTFLVIDDSPMLAMLNNTQPQLQIVVSNGLSGANLLSCQLDMQAGAYETTKLNGNDELEWEVTFKGVANATNAGFTGGFSPGKITLQNAVPTY